MTHLMSASVQFCGAAQTVTGSRFLVEVDGARVLVDCGMFQGLKELRLRNWDAPPFDPASIDAVILTHAHIDHTGALPRLVAQGFKGPVYCTPATRELIAFMLPDSARLQEEEARFANKHKTSKHAPAMPLYTEEQAEATVKRARAIEYGRAWTPCGSIEARFHPSGHILGAAFVELRVGDAHVVLSGDVGGRNDAIMRPPAPIPPGVKTILVESTYGGRTIQHRPVEEQFAEQVAPVLGKGGVVVIPAFAVGRTTLVLYHLRKLQEADVIPDVPVYIDSPMATDAAEIYSKYAGEHNLRAEMLQNPELCSIRAKHTTFIRTRDESKRLNDMKGPRIIISASGMASGGRVLHHLKRALPDPRNLVLLSGYQAVGTRGRALLERAPTVKIHGDHIPVRCKVGSINGLSAHGNADEMIEWLRTASPAPRMVHLVHGEPPALAAMAQRVKDDLGFPHHIPQYLERAELD